MSNEDGQGKLHCPDGGTCHHDCITNYGGRCWRVNACSPFTSAFPGYAWPEAIKALHKIDDRQALLAPGPHVPIEKFLEDFTDVRPIGLAPEEGSKCDAIQLGHAPSMIDGHCTCTVCPRCHHHTGNAHYGHYSNLCRVTREWRDGHLCCPVEPGCELEAATEARKE